MSADIAIEDAEPVRPHAVVHPAWVRVTHWINAVAMLVMIMSGWRIYNASPLFEDFDFPNGITLGGWLAGALLWHFAAMWVLAVNGLVYVALGFVTGRFRRRLLPVSRREVAATLREALTLRLVHDNPVHDDPVHDNPVHGDPARYNAVQKLLYIAVLLAGVLVVASGLSIWKPVQLWWLTALFGGYDAARYVHFFAMAAIVGFVALHIVMALIVPRHLRAMIVGR